MQNRFFTIFHLFLRIYASYILAISLLLLPPMIWINQSISFGLSSPLFLSSKLKQNVLDALNIVLFGSNKSTHFIQSEVSHLHDVHVLFVFFYLLGLINLLLLYLFFRKKRLKKSKYLGALSGIALVSVFSMVFFQVFFDTFHNLLFPQGNFAFPFDSILIQTFPPSFWFLQFLEMQLAVLISLWFQFRGAD